jgi:hypothetical protein
MGRPILKQYCTFAGSRAMLQHTLAREREAQSQLADRPRGTVIVQPANRNTAAGVFLPLTRIYKRDPEKSFIESTAHADAVAIMVVAVKPRTLWRIGCGCFPEAMSLFERLQGAIGNSREDSVLDSIYEAMPALNSSADLPIAGILWSGAAGRRLRTPDKTIALFPRHDHAVALHGIPAEALHSSLWQRFAHLFDQTDKRQSRVRPHCPIASSRRRSETL